MTNTCIRCHKVFESFRASRYCSDACRQKVWRSGPGKPDREATEQPTTTRTLAELACMWCNRSLGWVPMTPSGTTLVPRSMRPSGLVLVPRSLRCPVCGGPPLATGEVEVQRADTSAEARKAFHGDPWEKRVGRPSKEVAEARRQALQVEW